MRTNESFLSRHLWWVGLLFLDAFYVLFLPSWSAFVAEVLLALFFIAIASIYAIVVVVKLRRIDGRVPVISQEFEALRFWLWLGGLTLYMAVNTLLFDVSSAEKADSDIFFNMLLYCLAVGLLIRHAMAWLPDETIVRDERGQQLENDSRKVAFAALAVMVLLTPILLFPGDGAEPLLPLTRNWLLDFFAFCVLFSYWSGRTYVVYRYAQDRFLNWKAG